MLRLPVGSRPAPGSQGRGFWAGRGRRPDCWPPGSSRLCSSCRPSVWGSPGGSPTPGWPQGWQRLSWWTCSTPWLYSPSCHWSGRRDQPALRQTDDHQCVDSQWTQHVLWMQLGSKQPDVSRGKKIKIIYGINNVCAGFFLWTKILFTDRNLAIHFRVSVLMAFQPEMWGKHSIFVNLLPASLAMQPLATELTTNYSLNAQIKMLAFVHLAYNV